MDKIRVLSDGVANQIAAGEVVTRPASVVKELLENAVDAGATSVTVGFRDGGRGLIRVVDNGHGMSESDARMAFERHATSKIRNTEDLYNLSSFGFRGEALPSISSVSETELRTRMADREVGTRVAINGGVFAEQTSVQVPRGTQLTVKNLFYNIPARRKFLKEPHVEARYVMVEFQRVALCNPHIAFTLHNNDSLVYSLPPGNLRQRIAGVHGKALANHLLNVDVDTSIVRIEGFAGHPSIAKKTNKEQYLFVNGRYFRSPYFHKAVMKAYEKLIAPETQPAYFLYFTIDPDRIDVNVHPAKTEIKFDDEQAVWQILNAAVRESLGKLGVVPMMDFEMDTSIEIPVYREGVPCKLPDVGANPGFNPFHPEREPAPEAARTGSMPIGTVGRAQKGWENLYEIDSGAGGLNAHPEMAASSFDRSLLDFIQGDGEEPKQGVLEIESGNRFRGLLLLDDRHCVTALGDSLVVIDIRHARERVFYERYLRMLGHGTSASQQLLFPERIEFDAADLALLAEIEADLQAFGFDYTPAANAVEVKGIPPELSPALVAQTLNELIGSWRETGQSPREDFRSSMAAVMARQGARSASGPLTVEALEPLIDALMDCENMNFTPYGHPVLVWITHAELSKRFKARPL